MGQGSDERKVNEVVMFSSSLQDFFYAPYNQMANTFLNMTFSLTPSSDAGHWPAEAERAAGIGATEKATGAGL
jgi:hypothetical protein